MMQFDPTSATPVSGGFDPDSATPVTAPPTRNGPSRRRAPLAAQQANAPQGYLQSIGNAAMNAVKQFGQGYKNEAANYQNEAQKPFGQQLYDMTIGGVADAVRPVMDAAQGVNSVIHAAANPALNAAVSHLPQSYVRDTSQPGFRFRPATPQEANNQLFDTLSTAASLVAPESARGGLANITPAPDFVPPPQINKVQAKALQLAQRDLQKNPAAFAQNMQSNPDLMFAEAAGPNAMTRVKALGNMNAANVGDQVAATMADRVASTTPRINTAAQNLTGFDPSQGENAIDAIVKAGQAKAAPLYDAFYGQQLDSPTLRDIVQSRPAIRDALAPAAKNMLNAGIDPYFTKENISLPDVLPTGSPAGDPSAYLQDVRDMMGNGAKTAIRSDGPTLNEFIAANGGIKDTGGDLSQIMANAQTYNRGRGLGKIIRPNGSGMDDMARAATDAGYFREEPSANEFLAAVDRELSGGPVRLPGSGADRARYLQGLQQRADNLGLSGKPSQVAQGLANDDAMSQHLEDMANGLHGGVTPILTQDRLPTSQHLDYVKRLLDDQINNAVKNGENEKLRGLLSAKSALVDEMTRMSPEYWNALDVSGDYLSAKDAFGQSSRKFMSPQVTPKQYSDYVGGLSSANKDANLQGLLSDINNRLNAKEGAPNSLDFLMSPNARQKLTIAAAHRGQDVGDKLYQEIHNAAQIRANARFMMPRQGSATQPLLSAERDIMGDVGMGKIPTSKSEIVGAAIDKVSQPIQQLWLRFQNNQSRPVLREYARLLMQRGDLTVDEIGKIPPGSFKTFLNGVAKSAPVMGQSGSLGKAVSAPLLPAPAAAAPPRKKQRQQ